jgi:hypothetical protein
MYETDARTFFRDIDPLAEIAKKMAELYDDPPPSSDQSSWAARFSKRS